ncbi:MAG: alpha-D-ribose 1-methylphosphonate 5-phosphate C-P-lyase PhnJ, partial [Cyanobacteria bacterium J06648_10]
AVPPYTSVKSLDFEDHPFTVEEWDKACEFCGATDSYLDEVVTDNEGGRLWICSDTDYCGGRQVALPPGPSPKLGCGETDV